MVVRAIQHGFYLCSRGDQSILPGGAAAALEEAIFPVSKCAKSLQPNQHVRLTEVQGPYKRPSRLPFVKTRISIAWQGLDLQRMLNVECGSMNALQDGDEVRDGQLP